jgi:Uri superfamily endonuclease
MSVSKNSSSARLETEDVRETLAEKDSSSKGHVQGASAAVKGCVARELAPFLSEVGRDDGTHGVYVVRLRTEVLGKKKFAEVNPNRHPSGQCLYVGLTGLSPSKRFENHKENYKASRWVRDYGIELLPRFYEPLNKMSYERADQVEEFLAEFLREKGHAVWQK